MSRLSVPTIKPGDAVPGDIVEFEMKRYGVRNEIYAFVVVRRGIRSNSWVNVPVQEPEKETMHESVEDVLLCVQDNFSEDLHRYRVSDAIRAYRVYPRNSTPPERPTQADEVRELRAENERLKALLDELDDSLSEGAPYV